MFVTFDLYLTFPIQQFFIYANVDIIVPRSNYYTIIRLCHPALLSRGSNARHYLPSTLGYVGHI